MTSLYPFKGDSSQHQLGFPAGVTVMARSGQEGSAWWWGSLTDGSKGWFPSSYVTPMATENRRTSISPQQIVKIPLFQETGSVAPLQEMSGGTSQDSGFDFDEMPIMGGTPNVQNRHNFFDDYQARPSTDSEKKIAPTRTVGGRTGIKLTSSSFGLSFKSAGSVVGNGIKTAGLAVTDAAYSAKSAVHKWSAKQRSAPVSDETLTHSLPSVKIISIKRN